MWIKEHNAPPYGLEGYYHQEIWKEHLSTNHAKSVVGEKLRRQYVYFEPIPQKNRL
jgi:hypothetical protein